MSIVLKKSTNKQAKPTKVVRQHGMHMHNVFHARLLDGSAPHRVFVCVHLVTEARLLNLAFARGVPQIGHGLL